MMMKKLPRAIAVLGVAFLVAGCGAKDEKKEDPLASPYLKTMEKAEKAEKELEQRAEELEAELKELDP